MEIVQLHAANPGPMTGGGNWTYLLSGRSPVLIDAGVGAPAHIDAIVQHRPSGPGHVLVTHVHSDHASGAQAVAARWPETRFSKYPWPEQDTRYAVTWHPLHDQQRIAAGDDALEAIHTPGHAPDHVCFWHAGSRTLFSGDLVLLGGTVVIPASYGGSLSAYLHSLKRVLVLSPLRLLPAHGSVIDDPDAVIRRYLDHRHQRELQVLSALEAGLQTVDQITERLYVGLETVRIPMARESVLAHLRKLEDDGLAHRSGESWRPAS